jgi:CRP-like cAMP-binding protein
LLTGEERSATVRATSPLEVYSLAQKDFSDLVETQTKLRASLSQIVAERSAAYEAAALAAGIELESV